MQQAPDLVLGLDGGGTRTRLAVADREGAVLHFEQSTTLDPFADPIWPDKLAVALAGVAPLRPRIAGAVFGLPCYGEVAAISRRQRDIGQRLFGGPLEVVNDVAAALDGALDGAPGVLLLAGTGSMAWARNGTRDLRCGGWGDLFGDEGSGYWIGREALGEIGRAIDGRSPHRAFADGLLAALGLHPEGLITWAYALPSRRTSIAGIAAMVDTLAEAGQPAAIDILERAGDALASHARACAERLGLSDSFVWSHAGGVFHSRTVMRQVAKRLAARPTPPRLPPVGGALLRAARRAGWTIDTMWIERLEQSLSKHERSAEAA